MDTQLNPQVAVHYRSATQKIRVITEKWLADNMYCPACGHDRLKPFANNRPVADGYCTQCAHQYELKSKKNAFDRSILGGAYQRMLERIDSADNPHFLLLAYDHIIWRINSLYLVPNYLFTPGIIEARPPLPSSARRAGWVGCKIRIDLIPDNGKIAIISEGKPLPKNAVIEKYKQLLFLKEKEVTYKGWLLAVMTCIDKLPDCFTLNQVYAFTGLLATQFPNNHNIDAKIRQQLQILRDQGLLEFVSRGHYQKIKI